MTRSRRKPKSASKKKSEFNAQAFLDSAGVDRKVRHFKKAEIIFLQGSPANTVMYIQEGAVKITALSAVGKEAIFLGKDSWRVNQCSWETPRRSQLARFWSLRRVKWSTSFTTSTSCPISSSILCYLATFASRRTWSTGYSIPRKKGSHARCS